MAALKTKNEVPLLLEAKKKILWRFDFDIWTLLLLCEHAESIIETDVGNEVPRTCVLLVFGRGRLHQG